MRKHAYGSFVVLALAACKGAERPRPPPALAQTVAVGRAGTSLRGVASDGALLYAGFNASKPAARIEGTIEARRGDKVVWQTKLGATIGELAIAGRQLAVVLGGSGSVQIGTPLELRGDPAAILATLDREAGTLLWRLAFDSTEWALITSVAAADADIVVAGSFAGTLRAGKHVVSSAGGSDGFVARVTGRGQLVWLRRLGGPNADAVQGVATSGSRIAIAGTFGAGAELQGRPLTSVDERLPYSDAFVADLDGTGAPRWIASFGSRAEDAVAGVAIDRAGRVAVASNARDTVMVGSSQLITRGASDGIVVWYSDAGEQGAAILVGGADFDGLRTIAALGDHIAVGGFFSGSITLGDRTLTAGGGDDSFIAALDASGTVATAWHVAGAGREEITSLSMVPGGFVAGIAHTAAASVESAALAAPSDPASGAALVVRGL